MAKWQAYQSEVAEFFRSLGLEATTDEKLSGVKSKHDVDVVVRWRRAGFDLLWVVECKKWDSPVKKLYVHGLRDIVDDLGADRGILMSESGFQPGAIAAASGTNVHLSSLSTLRTTAASDLANEQLDKMRARNIELRRRYWAFDKEVRIEYGLRPEAPFPGYSGDQVMDAVDAALALAAGNKYPPDFDDLPPRLALAAAVHPDICVSAVAPSDFVAAISPAQDKLDELLTRAEAAVTARAKGNDSEAVD